MENVTNVPEQEQSVEPKPGTKAALEAENAELRAKLEALTSNTKKVEQEKQPERVELYIPRGSANDEPNLMIGFNGKNYLLPRGKKSMVPPEVAAEYQRSTKAQDKMDEHIDQMIANSK